MNVLSLFDGMSCGQIALKELGIKVNNYFASEIDSHAISQTKYNFPNTIHLGDVTKVSGYDLPKIDLLIGGSPCQGFSFAGKQLNFSDPRSVLFFEFVRILKELREVNPNIKFLLENVRMKKESERVITEILGVYPVVINSSLVSAQNRVRLYWSNIRVREEGLFSELHTDIPQPEDKELYIKDILEDNVADKYFLKSEVVENLFKHKERQKDNGNNFGIDIRALDKKSCTVSANGKWMYDLIAQPTCVAMRGREVCLSPKRTEYGKAIRKDYEAGKVKEQRKNIQQLEPITDGKTNTLTSVQKDNLILSGTFRTHKEDYGFREIKSGKAATIPARAREDGSGQNVCMIGSRIRRLTPKECARLQTIPSWYKWNCSETQIYKMLGNGWTVEVIKHIFRYLKK